MLADILFALEKPIEYRQVESKDGDLIWALRSRSVWNLHQTSQLSRKLTFFCLRLLELYFQHLHPEESYILQWSKHTKNSFTVEKTRAMLTHRIQVTFVILQLSTISFHIAHTKTTLNHLLFPVYCSYFSIYVILPTVLLH